MMNKLVTPIPFEFNTFGTISWKVIELVGRKYDAIIGQNILSTSEAKIDLQNNYMEINGNKIMFINNEYPFDLNNIQMLEPVNKSVKEILCLDPLNGEEQKN